MLVRALVAAREEADRIGETIAAIRSIPGVDEVVVVDDSSSDDTAMAASAAGARVLVSTGHLGKGEALEGALDRLEPAEIWLLLDADLGTTAAVAGALIDAVRGGEADLAIAAFPRDPRHGGLRLVKRLSAGVIRALCGFAASEPMSGQRAITAEALDAVRPLAFGFGVETAMTIDAVRLGFRVVEVPLPMSHRSTGRDLRGFLHRARQGRDVLAAVGPRTAGLR